MQPQHHHAMHGAPPPMAMAGAYHHHAGPVVVEQRGTAPGLGAKYNASAGRATGYVQLCCALASIALGVVQIVLESEVGVIGYGIWGGLLFFLPSGILGVASFSKNACVIVAYMVMSILSAMMGFVVLSMASLTAGVDAEPAGCEHYYHYHDKQCSDTDGLVAVSCLLVFAGLVEIITAIVASAFCCGGVCCGADHSSTVSHVVHYYPNTVAPIGMSGIDTEQGVLPTVGLYGGGHGVAPYPSCPPGQYVVPPPAAPSAPLPPLGRHMSPPPQYDTLAGGSGKMSGPGEG